MRVPRPAARMTALVLGVAAVTRLGDRPRLMEIYWATSESGGLYGRLRDRVKRTACVCWGMTARTLRRGVLSRVGRCDFERLMAHLRPRHPRAYAAGQHPRHHRDLPRDGA